MTSPRLRATMALLVAMIGATIGTARACDPPAIVPLLDVGGQPAVTAEIDGHEAVLVIDTGAARSVLDEEATRQLSIWRDTWAAMTMRGIGGDDRQRVADLQSFSIGGMPLRRRSIGAQLAVPVVALPGFGAAGLLGLDMLASYGVVLDFSARSVGLYPVLDGCEPMPGATTGLFVSASPDRIDHLIIPVEINGITIQAVFDTGAAATAISDQIAQRAGLTLNAPVGQPQQFTGLGPDRPVFTPYPARSFIVGADARRDLPIWVGPLNLGRGIDMLIGRDWIGRRRLLIDAVNRRIAVVD